MDQSSEHVVVTGANRGLGLEFVRTYAARGARVLTTARRPSEAAELQAIASDSEGRVVVCPLDLTRVPGPALRQLELMAGDHLGHVDILINNAGTAGQRRSSMLHDFEAKRAMEVYQTNVVGTLEVTRALWDRVVMVQGRIAMISSLMGSMTDSSGGVYEYRMSKTALNMATRCLGFEADVAGIMVFALHPGWVRTDMGGDEAPLSIRESVASMVATVDTRSRGDNGRFFDRNGSPLPW